MIESNYEGNSGIYLYGENSRDNIIINNTFINNSRLRISYSKYDNIFNNTFLNNATFRVYNSEFVNFSNNKFESYSISSGSDIDDSNNITMMNNHYNNTGLMIFRSYNNIIIDNFVNEKPLIYLEKVIDYVIPSAGQVILNNCSNITVVNQNLSNTKIGVQLYFTNNSKIMDNSINNSGWGVYNFRSHNNNLEENIINNNNFGFYFRFSDNNTIKNNSINGSETGLYFEYDCYNNIVENNDIIGLSGNEPPDSPQSYLISYKTVEGWKEIETLHLSKSYNINMIDVSDILIQDADEYVFRIRQRGGIAAHIDYIALYNGDLLEPDNAYNIEEKEDISSKIVKMDNDVVNAYNQVFEFKWKNKYDKTPRFLMLKANEELYANERPITTPTVLQSQSMMEYKIINDGYLSIKDIDNLKPDFRDIWMPGSGHPSGEVNLWLNSDGNDLFGILEVTSDNTYDETGWGSLYICKNGEIREYRITSNDNKYGESYFTYTDSVSWQHMVYQFCISLEEINSEIGETIHIGFGSYGTMTQADAGIFINNGINSTIRYNNISDSQYGIITWDPNPEKIINNKIFNNSMAGIKLDYYSANKNISSNHIYNNINGIVLDHTSKLNVIYSNNISNNIHSGINIVYDSNNNTIFNNNISNNDDGGINLYETDNNKFNSNIIKQNTGYGLLILSSNDNTFYNNYFENDENALDNYNNSWNITKTPGLNILNGPYLGGNYWSDYKGIDTDSDGLGNTYLPHNSSNLIKNGGDYHPLIKQENQPPVIISENPTNNSIDNNRPPAQLEVNIEDPDGNTMDIQIRWKRHDYYHTNEWMTLTTYSGVNNGTYTYSIPIETNWSWGNTTYTWSVNATDGLSWTNKTYTFTTDGSRYDVNNNDIVNFQDAGLVWVHRTSIEDYDGLYDVNNNGEVNFQDAGLTWVNRD